MISKSTSMKRFALFSVTLGLLFQTGCIAQTDETLKSTSDSTSTESSLDGKKESDSVKKVQFSESDRTDSTPKNIIVFIGDGMGISTITAGRIFDGQSQGLQGEDHQLAFETFPELALIKTYNTNAQVPDSAGTATAILSGYKTNIGAVNVPPDANIETMFAKACSGDVPPTLLDKAKASNKSVGIISTARLTHATPAAMYSHSASRDIEADKDLTEPMVAGGCKSIGEQLVTSDLDLALGGGAKELTPEQIARWSGTVATTASEMTAANIETPLLGLFTASHMSFEADRADTEEPSLAEMTSTAIDRLDDNADGYVLMVEAGRIDHAHHGTNAYRALRDLQALNEAVKTAVAEADDDTLILVTADHSHVFVMQGYPVRGNPILGLVKPLDRETALVADDYELAKDDKPFTTLGYYNGPNQRTDASETLTDNMVQAPDYRQQTAIPKNSETHAGEDVALYATGPGSDRFGGVMEQDEIGQALADFVKP